MMRKLAKQSPVRNTTTFYSIKNRQAFFIESQLELDFALRCEFDPEILSFRCQAEPEYYLFQGKFRRYTADVCIGYRAKGNKWVEVKYEKEMLKEENILKYNAVKEHFRNDGRAFCVKTEKQIRQGELCQNLQFLYRYKRFELSDCQLEALKLGYPDAITLQNVKTEDLTQIYQALAQDHLSTDLTRPLDQSTCLVWR